MASEDKNVSKISNWLGGSIMGSISSFD